MRLRRLPSPSSLLATALLALALLPRSVSGQQLIRGRVVDDAARRGVPLAQVTLLQGGQRILAVATDAAGRFELPTERVGDVRLEAEALGYRTVTSNPVELTAGDSLSVEIAILADAILMEPLVVTGRTNAGRNLFYRRMEEWGEGIFLGPDEIEAMELRHPADVFRNQEDVQLRWGWGRTSTGSTGPLPRIRTYRGTGCVKYMVDLVPVRPPPWEEAANPWTVFPLDGLQSRDVRAVEVYRYVGEAPPEIRRHAMWGDRLCGLVVIWTWAGW